MTRIMIAFVAVFTLSSAASANMLTNGDFANNALLDTGNLNAANITLNQWTGPDPSWDLSGGIAQHGSANDANSFGAGLAQVIAAPADGTVLTLSFDYVNSEGFGLDVHVYGMDSTAGFPGTSANPGSVSGATNFLTSVDGTADGDLDMGGTADNTFANHVETGITVSGGHDYLVVSFEFAGASAVSQSGVVERAIDNVELVPEPASLALLGLSGVLLAGRRRRA